MNGLDPQLEVCVCSFVDKNNNRILESQLHKGSGELFLETNMQSIFHLVLCKSWLGGRKDDVRGPQALNLEAD